MSPVYVYRDAEGRELEQFVESMLDAPPIGHELEHEGRTYRRVLSRVGLAMKHGERSAEVVGYGLPFVDVMTPEQRELVDGKDANGFAVFASPERARRFGEHERRQAEREGREHWMEYRDDGPSQEEVQRAQAVGEEIR